MSDNISPYKKTHVIAISAAVILHGGIAAWAMQAPEPVQVQQQIIKISMVAPSSIAQPKQVAQTQTNQTPLTPPQPDGLKAKKKIQKKLEQKVEKPQEKAAATPPTSGPQNPDAVEKVAARTDPIFNAAYLHNPAPQYPASARKKGAQGKVMLQVKVTSEGSAKEVSVTQSSGFALLDDAAKDAVKNWRFVPAKRGDEVVEAEVLVPVEFKLN